MRGSSSTESCFARPCSSSSTHLKLGLYLLAIMVGAAFVSVFQMATAPSVVLPCVAAISQVRRATVAAVAAQQPGRTSGAASHAVTVASLAVSSPSAARLNGTLDMFHELNGACRTEDGNAGSYVLHKASFTKAACHALCVQAARCIAFEVSSRGCETHTEFISHADGKSVGVTCFVRQGVVAGPSAVAKAAHEQRNRRGPAGEGNSLPGVTDAALRNIVRGLAQAISLPLGSSSGQPRFLFTIATREAIPLAINLCRTAKAHGATVGAVTLFHEECDELRTAGIVCTASTIIPRGGVATAVR